MVFKKGQKYQNWFAIKFLFQRRLLEIRLGSGVECRFSDLVWDCAQTEPKIFQSGGCINLSCMWNGCRRADPVVSQAYP